MAFSYKAKNGHTYYICLVITQSGNRNYSLRRRPSGLVVDEVPEGYKIADDGQQVMLKKVGKQKAKPARSAPPTKKQVASTNGESHRRKADRNTSDVEFFAEWMRDVNSARVRQWQQKKEKPKTPTKTVRKRKSPKVREASTTLEVERIPAQASQTTSHLINGVDLRESLARFGHRSFRPYQKEAIGYLLKGQDVLVVQATGSGKSLIYQVAAHHLPGITIVISPLIALMQDQVDGLESKGIRATFINSTLSPEEQVRRLHDMAHGAYQLVYIAPERLRQIAFQEEVDALHVGLLAVDEAHCISQWGHDFRPDYLYINEFSKRIGQPPLAALTATATPKVREDIRLRLGITNAKEVIGTFDRPNIHLGVHLIYGKHWKTQSKGKYAEVAGLLKGWRDGTAIVYVGRRKDAEHVAWFLDTQIHVPARYYHADMSPDERKEVQDAFTNGRLPVVVATNAFGMGIDRADVRLIVHHQMPGSLEQYYQEVGRAGRDGQPARAMLLYHPSDRQLHDYFIENSRLDYAGLVKLYLELVKGAKGQGGVAITRLDWLSRACGFDDKENVKASVGLHTLEQAGAICQEGYEGRDRIVHVNPLDAGALAHSLQELEDHLAWREQQLNQMIGYVEDQNHCRRRAVLSYFGENRTLPRHNNCCDVCG